MAADGDAAARSARFRARKRQLEGLYRKAWPRLGSSVDSSKVRCNRRSKFQGEVRACDARRSLSMRLSHYVRVPRCKVCGAREWRVDRYRAVIETGLRLGVAKPCNCGMYPFPHRRGSGICQHNPKILTEAEARDAQERFIASWQNRNRR